MKKFWNFRNLAEPETGQSERILEIDGTISDTSWLDDDVTPRIFKEELLSGTGPITLWLNSPGGDCIAASQIYTMLMDYKDDITVKIDGVAASAASVIAMAGTKVLMSPTALLMIHNPITTAMGDYRDMEQAISMLDEVKESIINAYERKTGLPRTQLSSLMNKETWFNTNKAIELGFCDGVLEDEKKKVPTEAYEFSTKEYAQAFLNKLSDKMKPSKVEGRNVDVLKERISTIRKVI